MSDLIIMAAIPCFLGLIALEYWADRKSGNGHYRLNDAFGSLSLGVMSRTSSLMIISLGALFIDRVLPEARWFEWSSSNPITWVATFVLYDFCYYWTHRMGHTLNVFWAGHSVHHQSEDYNLSTALRQTSSSIWTWIFGAPLLMLGAPIEVFLICGALNLLYQFWVHTQYIDKLGWMEYVMVTPSNHRVHHGQNPEYIDKNHGGVFILWDRIFGTFQPELDNVEIIYGVRSPLQSFNPVRANLQVWKGLIHDAWHTKNGWDKFRIWFMPTGWRPQDVDKKYPVEKSDLDNFEKFDPQVSLEIRHYALFQLAAAVPLLVYFVWHFTGLSYLLVSLGFLMISLPLITTGWMLEGRSGRWEKIRLVVSWIGFSASWGIMAPSSVAIFGGYLALNTVVLLWLIKSRSHSDSLSTSHV